MTTFPAQTYAEPITLVDTPLDGYAARGVALSRDAASLVMAALRRDAYEMRLRGGEPNREAAAANMALADSILEAVNAPLRH